MFIVTVTAKTSRTQNHGFVVVCLIQKLGSLTWGRRKLE